MKAVCPACNEGATCPTCGNEDGVLGTSFAYFICTHWRDAGHEHAEQYWLGDHRHPVLQSKEWKDAVLAAPHGRCGTGARYFEEAD